MLEKPELKSDPRFESNFKRNENRAALEAIILEVFGQMTAAQVISRLEAAPIANAQVNTMADVWAHPQLKARDRWQTVDSPAGALPALLPPGVNNQYDYRMDAIPDVGQHNAPILAELGFPANFLS